MLKLELSGNPVENTVYRNFLKQMLQVKRNKLYEDMLKLNEHYDKFLKGDDKSPIHNTMATLANCRLDTIEIEEIQSELNELDNDDEFI